MDKIVEHESIASELEAILNDAPYPTLDELKRRVDGARDRRYPKAPVCSARYRQDQEAEEFLKGINFQLERRTAQSGPLFAHYLRQCGFLKANFGKGASKFDHIKVSGANKPKLAFLGTYVFFLKDVNWRKALWLKTGLPLRRVPQHSLKFLAISFHIYF